MNSLICIEEHMKPINGYEGLYSVTRDGRVWSHERIIKRNRSGDFLIQGRWMKPILREDGYLHLNLRKNEKMKKYLVHRLVALTFILNPENKCCINHKNGIKTDNRVENLEWVTYKENSDHAWKLGLYDNIDYEHNRGENNGNSKLSQKQVNEIRENHDKMKWGDKPYEKYGITRGHYYQIINNKTWR